MKMLNRTATAIFRSLIEGLAVGEAKKIGDGKGGIMAVHVDCLEQHPDGARLYAVAHRFVQNGDSCPDPDVEFYVTPLGVAPTAIDHPPPFGYARYVTFEGGKPARWNPRGQRDLTSFCNTWMVNIQAQQGLKVAA